MFVWVDVVLLNFLLFVNLCDEACDECTRQSESIKDGIRNITSVKDDTSFIYYKSDAMR